MKRTSFLALFLGAIALLMTGCGTSDSVKSVQLGANSTSTGGFFNLAGADGTLQLTVTAVYNSGKLVDVTNQSTYSAKVVGAQFDGTAIPPFGPPNVTVNATGLMTDITPMCTWVDVPTSNPPDPPNWLYTGYYQVTATYKGMSSQPVAIGVGSLSSNDPKGACGP